MYTNNLFIYTLLFILSCLYSCNNGEKIVKSKSQSEGYMDEVMRARLVRCSRRFTPGACEVPVDTVWMFDAQQQNCTERLGCPSNMNTNRFMSYLRCMAICQPLINMYSMILTDILKQHSYLRTKIEHTYDPEMDRVLLDAYESEDAPMVNVPAEPVKDMDLIELEDMMPPDIDRRF